jgi:hypothetical protein
MKKKPAMPVDEPMGIVISRGAERDPTPSVLAFVWGTMDLDVPELAAV